MIEPLLEAERALSFGLLDQAERLYRAVADADPRNSIAVVGLARVELDRGDDRGALALARRALEIDPQNVAAQRLVARLQEVLEARGEAVAPGDPGTEPGPVSDPVSGPVPGPVSGPARPAPTKPKRRRSLLDRLRRTT